MIKKIYAKLRIRIIRILSIIIALGISFTVFIFFRFIGLKGLLGFVIGGLAVGFAMLSEHPMIVVYREYFLR